MFYFRDYFPYKIIQKLYDYQGRDFADKWIKAHVWGFIWRWVTAFGVVSCALLAAMVMDWVLIALLLSFAWVATIVGSVMMISLALNGYPPEPAPWRDTKPDK